MQRRPLFRPFVPELRMLHICSEIDPSEGVLAMFIGFTPFSGPGP